MYSIYIYICDNTLIHDDNNIASCFCTKPFLGVENIFPVNIIKTNTNKVAFEESTKAWTY